MRKAALIGLLMLVVISSGCIMGGFTIQKDELFDNIAVTFNSPLKYHLQEEKTEQMKIKITNLNTNNIRIYCFGSATYIGESSTLGLLINCVNCASDSREVVVPPGGSIHSFTLEVRTTDFTIPGIYESKFTCRAYEQETDVRGGGTILRREEKVFPFEVHVLR